MLERARRAGTQIEGFAGLKCTGRGSEHSVVFRFDQPDIVHKYTGIPGKENDFPNGLAIALDRRGGPVQGAFVDGTPVEKLAQYAWSEVLFELKQRVAGVSPQGGIHTIQEKLLPGSRKREAPNYISREEIDDYMEHVGFVILREGTDSAEQVDVTERIIAYAAEADPRTYDLWFHPQSGVIATDVKPENFGRRKDGKLAAFDLVLLSTKRLFPVETPTDTFKST